MDTDRLLTNEEMQQAFDAEKSRTKDMDIFICKRPIQVYLAAQRDLTIKLMNERIAAQKEAIADLLLDDNDDCDCEPETDCFECAIYILAESKADAIIRLLTGEDK